MLLLVITVIGSQVSGQSTSAAQRADDLRGQLLDAQAKEAALEARLRQLDEALKPENIERSLAGIGSTRPEELREQRRRQLTIERDGVRAQLRLVATSRERLEAAIRSAEGLAYQQSAEPVPPPVSQALIAQNTLGPRWLTLLAAGAIAMVGLAFAIAYIRRKSTSRDR
jgi:uncharacterized protein involved in exopolysaccharide biosynthesis